MNKQDCIVLQKKLNALGASLTVDGVYGPKTQAAEAKYLGTSAPIASEAPWMKEARKHLGKKESDSKFSAFLSGFWAKVGLPGYKSIVGSARAWCGLFVFMALFTAGGYQAGVKGAAGARNWGKFGVLIDHKRMGAPNGAVVHTNHSGNCSSGSGNHVGFKCGDSTAADLKSGKFKMLGGNQSNQVSIVSYPVYEICEVSWPHKPERGNYKTSEEFEKAIANWKPMPQLPIAKSRECDGKAGGAGSTR